MNLASRETAYLALFARLQNITGIKNCTRKLTHWQDSPMENQPVLYMEQGGEVRNPVQGLPARLVLEANLWLYVSTQGDPVGPVLNPLLDAIGDTLEPIVAQNNRQTLGGVVHHCWIEGQTQVFEGNLGEEAVAIIPVKMLVT
jgi:hypothetical protein